MVSIDQHRQALRAAAAPSAQRRRDVVLVVATERLRAELAPGGALGPGAATLRWGGDGEEDGGSLGKVWTSLG